MHEDGFADTCDGLGGGATRERALDIMRDSRLGTYGAAGLGLMLATKVLALAAAPPEAIPWLLIAAHAASRSSAVLAIATSTYVRDAGIAKPVADTVALDSLALVLATGAAALCALLTVTTPAVILAGLGGLAVGHFVMRGVYERKLGGERRQAPMRGAAHHDEPGPRGFERSGEVAEARVQESQRGWASRCTWSRVSSITNTGASASARRQAAANAVLSAIRRSLLNQWMTRIVVRSAGWRAAMPARGALGFGWLRVLDFGLRALPRRDQRSRPMIAAATAAASAFDGATTTPALTSIAAWRSQSCGSSRVPHTDATRRDLRRSHPAPRRRPAERGRVAPTTLRHRRLRFTEQSLLLWIWQVG